MRLTRSRCRLGHPETPDSRFHDDAERGQKIRLKQQHRLAHVCEDYGG